METLLNDIDIVLFDASLEHGDIGTARNMLAIVRQIDGANGNFHKMRDKYLSAVVPG